MGIYVSKTVAELSSFSYSRVIYVLGEKHTFQSFFPQKNSVHLHECMLIKFVPHKNQKKTCKKSKPIEFASNSKIWLNQAKNFSKVQDWNFFWEKIVGLESSVIEAWFIGSVSWEFSLWQKRVFHCKNYHPFFGLWTHEKSAAQVLASNQCVCICS